MKKPLIGFIGQGWIGKNYADDFERRGYKTIRYALEEPYRQNKEKIRQCKFVFIAVPTPTTPKGFDSHIVESALTNLAPGTAAIIKSTLQPSTTAQLQKKFPRLHVMHSPEFLSRATAAQDAAQPMVNIIGIPVHSPSFKKRAQTVLSLLPKAPSKIVPAQTAELFKYVHNTTLFARSIFMNLLYDVAEKLDVNWADIKELITLDPMIAFQEPNVAKWHIEPNHKSGRGVGGDCHIKDFETLSRLYKALVTDNNGQEILDAMKKKNLALLIKSKKDLHLVEGVYGKKYLKK